MQTDFLRQLQTYEDDFAKESQSKQALLRELTTLKNSMSIGENRLEDMQRKYEYVAIELQKLRIGVVDMEATVRHHFTSLMKTFPSELTHRPCDIAIAKLSLSSEVVEDHDEPV